MIMGAAFGTLQRFGGCATTAPLPRWPRKKPIDRLDQLVKTAALYVDRERDLGASLMVSDPAYLLGDQPIGLGEI
jgi:hypothetical protein